MAKYQHKPGGYTWRQTLVEARQGNRANISRQEKLLAAAQSNAARVIILETLLELEREAQRIENLIQMISTESPP